MGEEVEETPLVKKLNARGRVLYEKYKRDDGAGHPAMNDAGLFFSAATEIESLRASLTRAEAESAWRSIETAPKDGTSILVHCKNGGTYAVWWSAATDPGLEIEPCWCVVGGGDLARRTSDARTPVLWRNIPRPTVLSRDIANT